MTWKVIRRELVVYLLKYFDLLFIYCSNPQHFLVQFGKRICHFNNHWSLIRIKSTLWIHNCFYMNLLESMSTSGEKFIHHWYFPLLIYVLGSQKYQVQQKLSPISLYADINNLLVISIYCRKLLLSIELLLP